MTFVSALLGKSSALLTSINAMRNDWSDAAAMS